MSVAGSPKFMSQAEFAKRRDVSRKAVTSWKQKGLLVLSEGGLVDVDASEWKLDQRPSVYRGGVTHRPIRKVEGNSPQPGNKLPPPAVVTPPPLEESGDDLLVSDFDLDDPNLSHAEAIRRKENYLGLLRRRDLEISDREWVRTEDVVKQVEQEYATVRERLLIIPGKMSALLVGQDRAAIEAALRGEITEALHELHDPEGIAAAAELLGAAAEGEAGA